MNLKTISYHSYETHLPQTGRHIIGQIRDNNCIVYQAFNPDISDYALRNQQFGGSAYSFQRMSWIKPNFLWMMYRSGWASKPGQERILAIEINIEHLGHIFSQSVHSSFQADIYPSHEAWQAALQASDVRLQWDPDHDPYGRKLERKALQLGMRGETLRLFATKWIISIEDITDFVALQRTRLMAGDMSELLVAEETIIKIL